ncbi:MAG: hypothetical protein WDO73_10385 [Ignavibacteriota bacterium]
MDVKTYYKRIREMEATIAAPYAVVVSLQTDDGGKQGVMVEVPRRLAAKMVVEGSAILAEAKQAVEFRGALETAYKSAQETAAASKLEVTMVSSDELKKLTDDVKRLKSGAKVGKD